jgi:hypothetical protein
VNRRWPILFASASLLVAAIPAAAKEKYLGLVDAKYPKAGASCSTCHATDVPTKGNRGLNPYGLDVKKRAVVRDAAGKKTLDLSKVEALDSDKDGKSNLEELKAGTNPGDPASK